MKYQTVIVDVPINFWNLFNIFEYHVFTREREKVLRVLNLVSPVNSQQEIELEYVDDNTLSDENGIRL